MTIERDFIGERLRELREANGWTQVDLAKKIKVSKQTVHDYEIGKKSPSREKLNALADIFNTSVDYLMGRTDIKQPVDELKRELQSKVPDLMTIAKYKRPTLFNKPISEEDAKKWNMIFEKLFDAMEQELAGVEEKKKGD